jgi:hypothetical protein
LRNRRAKGIDRRQAPLGSELNYPCGVLLHEGVGGQDQTFIAALEMAAKLASISGGLAKNALSSSPSVCAAARNCSTSLATLGLSGFHSAATRCRFGNSSFRSDQSHLAL